MLTWDVNMCLEQFKDTKMDKFKSQIEGQKTQQWR
jgi:hypothetical protein